MVQQKAWSGMGTVQVGNQEVLPPVVQVGNCWGTKKVCLEWGKGTEAGQGSGGQGKVGNVWGQVGGGVRAVSKLYVPSSWQKAGAQNHRSSRSLGNGR